MSSSGSDHCAATSEVVDIGAEDGVEEENMDVDDEVASSPLPDYVSPTPSIDVTQASEHSSWQLS